MIVGIEALSFYTSRYYLPLSELATARGVDANKYLVGLGQEKMAVLPPDEDVVTLAANAAKQALDHISPASISMILLATESGIDQSKSCGIWVHHLLDLPKNIRIVELKQAYYSGCAALQIALAYIRQFPEKKVLLITTDVARYGLHTAAEPTQGNGACALVLSAEPKIIAFESQTGCYTSHVMDFFRPNYLQEALVDGKFSTKVYLLALAESWKEYTMQSLRSFSDHGRFCYHIPFTRMAEKAHERLVKIATQEGIDPKMLSDHIQDSLHYSKELGNSYTASLFIGLISLLEKSTCDLSGERIGFFSYGSGCVAEFFSGIVLEGYQKHLKPDLHQSLLQDRTALTVSEYEEFYSHRIPQDGSLFKTGRYLTGGFRFAGVEHHIRLYERRGCE